MPTQNRHEDSDLTFYVSHEAWYASSRPDQKSEIMVSLASRGGGSSGEFGFRWYSLSGRQVPRLEVFEDAWDALREVNARTDGRFLEELAAMDGKDPQPNEVNTWLLSLGFKDRTQREDPDRQNPEEAEVDRLVSEICARFPHFGGGRGSHVNPIALTLKDKPPSFAAGVDVEAVVRFVLEKAGKESS